MTDRLKIGQEVLIHGYVDEIRKDTIIIRNEGGYFGTVECEVTDTEMPNTNEVLNKIRAEIIDCLKALDNIAKSGFNIYLPIEISSRRLTYQQCLEFIDKYKSESDKV